MSTTKNTAVILIDPYNDFLHPEGKLYSALAESLKEADTIRHINELLTAARASKIPVYYGLHQQYKLGFFDGWKHIKALQQSQKDSKAFEEGSWGAEIFKGMEPLLENNDVVVSKHWSSR
jgi:nicotinamidase-related amidase